MSAWLDSVRAALDAAPAPLVVFIRDDDAGWEDARLARLLDVTERHGAPIDLAVIPVAMDAARAKSLRERRAASAGLMGLHQHGYRHVNHQPEGRNCEFGSHRTRREQHGDIAAGQAMLADLLDGAIDPFFTPPWNRCTHDTATVLADLGFTALSRDVTAEPFDLPGLAEPRVAFDWFGKRKGVPLTRVELGVHLASGVREATTLGVMFHHAVMDDDDFAGVEELVALLARHPMVELRSMADVVDTMATIGEMA